MASWRVVPALALILASCLVVAEEKRPPAELSELPSDAGVTLPNVIHETAKLLASDGVDNDRFGRVAIRESTAVVGAIWDGDNGEDSGSAYVFRACGSGWCEEAKLLASDGAEGDRFGSRMALSGDTAVVGANYDDDNGTQSGSAYVFVRGGACGSPWCEEAKLLPSDGATEDRFGQYLADDHRLHRGRRRSVDRLAGPCTLDPGVYWMAQEVRQDSATQPEHLWAGRTVQSDNAAVWRNPDDGYGTGCVDWTPQAACGVGGDFPDFMFQIYGVENEGIQVPAIGPVGLLLIVMALGGGCGYVPARRRRSASHGRPWGRYGN